MKERIERLRSGALCVRGFLRGFLGIAETGESKPCASAKDARAALTLRAANRKSCC